MGKLEDIFQLQKSFQQLLGNPIPIYSIDFINIHNIELIKNQILALVDETMEALREIPWKPWKIKNIIDVPKFRVELIDIFHFLINLFIFAGMDASKVWSLFLEKNRINVKRQENGY